MSLLIVFVSFILGVQGGVLDLQFCSGKSHMVLDYTVRDIYLYLYDKVQDNPTSSPCYCDVMLAHQLDTMTVSSLSTISDCYDVVRFTNGPSSVDFACQLKETKKIPIYGNSTNVRMALYQNTTKVNKQGTILPVKIILDPPQDSLSVTCYAAGFASSSKSSIALSSTSPATPTPSTTYATALEHSASSEANYTPLVVGIVGVGVIAGSCIVCIIVCRVKRKPKDFPEQPKERLHQSFYRTTSNMFKTIITKRPLPHLPMSLRRTRKHQLAGVCESGLYDSIRSQRQHTGVTPVSKPEVTQKTSNDSSICYIHPVSEANNETPISFVPGRSTDSSTGTYLTKVILDNSNTTGEHSGTTPSAPADDNMYVDADTHTMEADSSYLYASVPRSHACIQDVDNKVELPGDNLADTNDNVYMEMNCGTPHIIQSAPTAGADPPHEENKDLSYKSQYENVAAETDINKGSTTYIDTDSSTDINTDRTTDNTFPRLLGFQSLQANSSRVKDAVKEKTKPKPKRHIRVVGTVKPN